MCTRAGAPGGRVHTCRCLWWPCAHMQVFLVLGMEIRPLCLCSMSLPAWASSSARDYDTEDLFLSNLIQRINVVALLRLCILFVYICFYRGFYRVDKAYLQFFSVAQPSFKLLHQLAKYWDSSYAWLYLFWSERWFYICHMKRFMKGIIRLIVIIFSSFKSSR